LKDESGWAWFIPLHNGTVSVGVVLHQDIYSRKRKELRESGDDSSLETLYHATLNNYAPDIKVLLGEGVVEEGEDGATVKQASDFSYNAPRHAGPRYRVIGDASGMPLSTLFRCPFLTPVSLAFIDPFFSSGVHLAVAGGLSAAATICAEIRGHCTPEEAEDWHTTKVGTSYVR
jgi:flavine halogenase